jgi:hypothetical protein
VFFFLPELVQYSWAEERYGMVRSYLLVLIQRYVYAVEVLKGEGTRLALEMVRGHYFNYR